MTRTELEKNGILIKEKDIYDGFIYLYTAKYFYYNNKIYLSEIHSNMMRYTGKNNTYCIISDLRSDLEKFDPFFYFDLQYGLDKECLEKLEEIISKENKN